jgi:hypothetical protein
MRPQHPRFGVETRPLLWSTQHSLNILTEAVNPSRWFPKPRIRVPPCLGRPALQFIIQDDGFGNFFHGLAPVLAFSL